jgi:hypothetical protein
VVVGGEVFFDGGAGAGGGVVSDAWAIDAEAIGSGGVEGEGGGDWDGPDGAAEGVVVLGDEGFDQGELPAYGATGGAAVE